MQSLFLLAQTQQPTAAEAAGAIAALLVVLGLLLLVVFGVNIVVCVLLYMCQSRVPPEHQKIAPGMIFLLLIPLFNLIWNFIVLQRIPASFQSYFASRGRTDVGDCGKGIGLWLAICVVASMVPCVNYIAGPAALVLLIVFLIKAFDLRGKIIADAAAPPASPTE